MDKKEKIRNIIVVGMVMAVSLSIALNVGNIFGGIGRFLDIINPIFLGCMIAVILNVPMEALSRVFEKMSGKVKFLKKEKTRNGKPCYNNCGCCIHICIYNMDGNTRSY